MRIPQKYNTLEKLILTRLPTYCQFHLAPKTREMPKRNPINATQPLKTRKHRTATQQSLQRPQLERGGNFPFPHNFFFSHRPQRKNTNTYVDRRSSDPDHSLRCGQPHSAHKHKIFVTFTIFHFTSSHSITNHSNCFLTAQRQGW